MAIWGIGAYNHKEKDLSQDFIRQGHARIGWGREEAPAYYEKMRSVKVGDIIYIKSTSRKKKTLHVKAIGIVTARYTESEIGPDRTIKDIDQAVHVAWKSADFEIDMSLALRNNVYFNTLYEENDPAIAKQITDELVHNLAI